LIKLIIIPAQQQSFHIQILPKMNCKRW